MGNIADFVILMLILACCASSVASVVGGYWNCNNRTWDIKNFSINACTNFDFSPSWAPSPP